MSQSHPSSDAMDAVVHRHADVTSGYLPRTPLEHLLAAEGADQQGAEMDLAKDLDQVWRKWADRTGQTTVPRTPLQELLHQEADEDDADPELRMIVRIETLRRMLEFVFQSGPCPLRVLRYVFALTKAVNPGLIGDMSLDDIAIICADGGKATVSARIKTVYNETLQKVGDTRGRASFQKRSAKYSAAQQGNTNRTKQAAKIKPKRRGK